MRAFKSAERGNLCPDGNAHWCVVTLCDVPGSDVRQMAASLQHLLAIAPPASPAYEAHAEIPLQPSELKDLAAGVAQIAGGKATPIPAGLAGLPMKRYDIGQFPILLPAEHGSTLPPQASPQQTLDWLNRACGQP